MDNTIYHKVLKQSSLIFKIKDTASEIYKVWREYTKPQCPHYPFEASDSTLATDLKNAFAKDLSIQV